MRIDAIVLAGGRSSRLGGVPKAQLKYGEQTLLQRTVSVALTHARRVVVVGEISGAKISGAKISGADISGADISDADISDADELTKSVSAAAELQPARVLVTREDPPFGGPAAGIAAGDAVLAASAAKSGADVSEFTIVLACDMPNADTAVHSLLAALSDASDDQARLDMATQPPVAQPKLDGVIAVDAGQKRQPLAAIYNTARLAEALEARRCAGKLDGLSAFALISELALVPVFVPSGSTDDVDTWADAEKFGMHKERH